MDEPIALLPKYVFRCASGSCRVTLLISAVVLSLNSAAYAKSESPSREVVTAVCAVLAHQFDDVELSKVFLKEFRQIKKVPFFVSNKLLIALGSSYLDYNYYTVNERSEKYKEYCIK
ncbi:MAG: hypothetical protein QMB16_02225 [Paracoccaceae bacterium]|jgi:hypothetical protein